MLVKHHGYSAHKVPAQGGDAKTVGMQRDQPLLLQLRQPGHFWPKVRGEINLPIALDMSEQHFALAHDGHDDGTADLVVARELQAALHGELALLEQLAVVFQRLGVLAVAVADAADGRYAQSDQVMVGAGAVALKVSLQLPVLLGLGQIVIGQGEVIHANVHIARLAEVLQGQRQQVNLVVARRKGVRVDTALRLEALGQVGVGI